MAAPLMAAPAYEDERYFRSLPKEELAGADQCRKWAYMHFTGTVGNKNIFTDMSW